MAGPRQDRSGVDRPGAEPDPLCCAGRSRTDSLRTLRRIYIRPRVHRGCHGREYHLPQSTYDDFARARRRRVTDNYVRENTIIAETIGPVQSERERLWFGKTFYDGEGNSGVVGFGYFDTSDRRYHLFVPPEVADYSVSAIRVEPDAVWMGIFQSGGYGGSPAGGRLYVRHTQGLHPYGLPDRGD